MTMRFLNHRSIFLRNGKDAINFFLNRLGLELSEYGSRLTMNSSLCWLSTHGFNVRTVIDVGASDGRWSRGCMRFYPNSRYVLFEPNPIHAPSLDSFEKEMPDSVFIQKAAVGGAMGSIFFDVSNPYGGSLNAKDGLPSIECPMTTIDASLFSGKIEGPYLLKLDTHGFEKAILEGASDTLKKCEILIIEAYNFHIEPEAILFWQLCELLEKKGFRVIDCVDAMRRKHDGAFWQMDLVFVKSSWEGFSYVNYL